jgi:hypothetical protein
MKGRLATVSVSGAPGRPLEASAGRGRLLLPTWSER